MITSNKYIVTVSNTSYQTLTEDINNQMVFFKKSEITNSIKYNIQIMNHLSPHVKNHTI